MLSALTLAFALQTPKAVSLINGKDLKGWHVDCPTLDKDANGPKPFIIREGILVAVGTPLAHLITDESFANYKLAIEYRWTKQPGNSGVLVHCSTPRGFANFLPKSLEVQLMHGNAGDFWLTGEKITVPDMSARLKSNGLQLTKLSDQEKPAGEWNSMSIECRGSAVKVWVNSTLVNDGTECTAAEGRIALQSEGAEIEFRKIEITKL